MAASGQPAYHPQPHRPVARGGGNGDDDNDDAAAADEAGGVDTDRRGGPLLSAARPPRTVCCTAPPARARAVSLHAPGPKHRDHTTGGETIGAAMPLPSLSMMSLLEPRRWPLHLAHEPDARMLTAFTQGDGGRERER